MLPAAFAISPASPVRRRKCGDISLANQSALLGELDAYMLQLGRLRGLLAAGDGPALGSIYSNAQQGQHNWMAPSRRAEQQNKEGGD